MIYKHTDVGEVEKILTREKDLTRLFFRSTQGQAYDFVFHAQLPEDIEGREATFSERVKLGRTGEIIKEQSLTVDGYDSVNTQIDLGNLTAPAKNDLGYLMPPPKTIREKLAETL